MGKSFGELIENFLIGGNKTSLIADADGDLRIVGEFGQKKHKKVSDCWSLITIYRTGTLAGSNGPTVFIVKGKRIRSGYMEDFLMEQGAAFGLSIQMTENAFMTKLAWRAMTPKLVVGYRKLPYAEWNPQWWAIEIRLWCPS